MRRKINAAIQQLWPITHHVYYIWLRLRKVRPRFEKFLLFVYLATRNLKPSRSSMAERAPYKGLTVGSIPPGEKNERTDMKTILIPIWEEKKQYCLNIAYVKYVRDAGYQPLMVGYDSNVEKLADLADGLLLSGGGDIDPIYYGADNLASFWPDPERDEIERRLYWAFIERDKPIFGICRGFQLIYLEEMKAVNDAFKLDEKVKRIANLEYIQHINSHSQSERTYRWLPSHRIFHSTSLYNLAVTDDDMHESMYVNSMHHQGVKWMTRMQGNKRYLGDVVGPVVPLAYSPAGSKEPIVVEAFTVRNRKVLAVQWHPEELDDLHLMWNIFGEPTGAEEAMVIYAARMESLLELAEEKNETD